MRENRRLDALYGPVDPKAPPPSRSARMTVEKGSGGQGVAESGVTGLQAEADEATRSWRYLL